MSKLMYFTDTWHESASSVIEILCSVVSLLLSFLLLLFLDSPPRQMLLANLFSSTTNNLPGCWQPSTLAATVTFPIISPHPSEYLSVKCFFVVRACVRTCACTGFTSPSHLFSSSDTHHHYRLWLHHRHVHHLRYP